jgi:hypothetical protein
MTITSSPFTRSAPLNLLGEELDPTPEQKRVARERYEDLGAWLTESTSDEVHDIGVYPQGSFNLGTSNRDPVTGEFDIDLVVRVEYPKARITQQELKDKVGKWLHRYCAARQDQDGYLAPSGYPESGKRAWTLHYADGFHMDILPVVPDLEEEIEATAGDPSWLTDRELRYWQETNPKGFAEWFAQVSEAERLYIRKRLAEARAVDVEDLPDDTTVKTTLQLAVQIMKRHRDRYFADDSDDLAPPSIVITALASLAYETIADIAGFDMSTLLAIVERMSDHIGGHEGEPSILNPTCPAENFADRYKDRPEKLQALFRWHAQLHQDLKDLIATSGPKISSAIDQIFGDDLGRRVYERIGTRGQELREAGAVGITATGGLTIGGSRPSKPHTFSGGT